MKKHFYQKTGVKNTILILIPTIISVAGIIASILGNTIATIIIICIVVVLLLIQIFAVIKYGNEDDKVYSQLEKLAIENNSLTTILAHMENDYKTVTSEVSAFSETSEKWASLINSFANNIKQNGYVSDKAWNKAKITDTICLHTKNVVQQYCNKFDNANISVGYISYDIDENGEEWVHMMSHSSPISIRPNACKEREKLSECIYHYAELIRNKLSDIEIAMNNEEVLRIFKKVSLSSDLNKYTQYIAIPLYCKSGKLLGIFQIVTKNGYIIENDKLKMQQFVTDNIIPFSNLIVLADKIYKGLYVSSTKINKEV